MHNSTARWQHRPEMRPACSLGFTPWASRRCADSFTATSGSSSQGKTLTWVENSIRQFCSKRASTMPIKLDILCMWVDLKWYCLYLISFKNRTTLLTQPVNSFMSQWIHFFHNLRMCVIYLWQKNKVPAVLLARASSCHTRPTNLTSPDRVLQRMCALTSERPAVSQLWSVSTHESISKGPTLLYLPPTHAIRQSLHARARTMAVVITCGVLPRRLSDD